MTHRTCEQTTTPTADTVPTATPAAALLAALWRSAPLSLLLDAANARILDAPDADDWFMGSAIQRTDGRLFLVMPPARPETERDTIARDLLARMVGVVLPGQTPTRQLAAA